MGASCSQAESGTEKQRIMSRRSFSSIKKLDKGNAALKPGASFAMAYDVSDPVGGNEMVLVATNHENEVEYVARAIEKREMPCQDMASIDEHLQVLGGLDHVHICRFVEAFDCNERIQLVYEKARSTTIFELDGARPDRPMGLDLAQVYCRQIAMALSVAHKQGIVHGRLRDTSLLVDTCERTENEEQTLKICDMGQTFMLRPARTGKLIDYESPEGLWGELPMPSTSTHFRNQLKSYMSSDMWSLGVLLFKMLTGRLPFTGRTTDETKEHIKSSAVDFGSEWKSMPEAKDLVHSLLKHSGRIRLTAEKVLKHPWILLSRTRVSRSKMMRVLQNVIFNATESTFKKFAMRVIAEDMSAEKLDIVTRAFRYIDKNGDGTLELEEIRAVLKKYSEEVLKTYGDEEGVADEIFDAIDRDASGTLNLAEFTAVSIGPSEYCNKETLWHTFNRFDKDGNGAFDKQEIMTVVREVEHLSDGALLEKEVEEISRNIDMPVDFDTFVQIIITPVGQSVSKLNCSWDRFCYNVMKVDNHKVRHIEPRRYDQSSKPANPLLRSPYARGSQYAYQSQGSQGEDSPKARRSANAARKASG